MLPIVLHTAQEYTPPCAAPSQATLLYHHLWICDADLLVPGRPSVEDTDAHGEFIQALGDKLLDLTKALGGSTRRNRATPLFQSDRENNLRGALVLLPTSEVAGGAGKTVSSMPQLSEHMMSKVAWAQSAPLISWEALVRRNSGKPTGQARENLSQKCQQLKNALDRGAATLIRPKLLFSVFDLIVPMMEQVALEAGTVAALANPRGMRL
jgi:hypothetical protein